MKAHLKDSENSIKEGSTVVANCGLEIPNALFVFIWDDAGHDVTVFDNPENLRGICKNCKVPWEKRMRYGLVNGQEIRTKND